MTELFSQLLPSLLDIGVGYFEYWDYDLDEMMQLVQSYKRREKARTQEKMALAYNQSCMIARFVGLTLNGKPLPKLYDIYPEFLDNYNPEVEDKKKEYNEAMRYKIRFMEMATAHNKARHKGGAVN